MFRRSQGWVLWTLSVRTNERPWCRLIEPTLPNASAYIEEHTNHMKPFLNLSVKFPRRQKSATLKTGRLTSRSPPWQLTQLEALDCLDLEWHGGVWWKPQMGILQPPTLLFLIFHWSDINQDISSAERLVNIRWFIHWVTCYIANTMLMSQVADPAVQRWKSTEGSFQMDESLPGPSKALPSKA